MTDYLCPRAWQ